MEWNEILEAGQNGLVFVWRIENFLFCTLGTGEFLTSPLFPILSDQDTVCWYLRLYPRGREVEGNLACYLYMEETENCEMRPKKVDVFLSILGANNENRLPKMFIDCAIKDGGCVGSENIVSSSELIGQADLLLPDGILTVCCQLWNYCAASCRGVICYATTTFFLESEVSFWELPKFSQWVPHQKIACNKHSSFKNICNNQSSNEVSRTTLIANENSTTNQHSITTTRVSWDSNVNSSANQSIDDSSIDPFSQENPCVANQETPGYSSPKRDLSVDDKQYSEATYLTNQNLAGDSNTKEDSMELILYSADESDEELIGVELHKLPFASGPLRMSCTISVLDGEGCYGDTADNDSYLASANPNKVWVIPCFIKKRRLHTEAQLYVPEDLLFLRCELSWSLPGHTSTYQERRYSLFPAALFDKVADCALHQLKTAAIGKNLSKKARLINKPILKENRQTDTDLYNLQCDASYCKTQTGRTSEQCGYICGARTKSKTQTNGECSQMKSQRVAAVENVSVVEFPGRSPSLQKKTNLLEEGRQILQSCNSAANCRTCNTEDEDETFNISCCDRHKSMDLRNRTTQTESHYSQADYERGYRDCKRTFYVNIILLVTFACVVQCVLVFFKK